MRVTTAASLAHALVVAFFFVGCGGGGGDSGPVASTASFPAQAAYGARVAAGSSDNFTVSGSCTGTASFTASPASGATFEGVAGFAVTATQTLNLTNCTPASIAVSATAYYDANYTPLGTSILGVEYSKFLTAPPPLPATVHVGDTAVYATLTVYTDSTKSVVTGQRVLSYVVEADSANTAIANFITRSYDTAGQLLATQQTRYRITTTGAVTLLTIDIQYSTTSTIHLVLTKV